MPVERAKRKLTAILSADVKGYSRLMGEDEFATVNTLKKYREVISSQVQSFSGRVVDSPGDNILSEFGSAVDAVECAVKIQEALVEQNSQLREDRRMEFRIGVNLGDVIHDEGRIYGDGVNVAARVEGLAEGGGVCISGTTFDQIGKKLSLGYEYMGEKEVKNIEKPVRVYRVLTKAEAAGKVFGEEEPKPFKWPRTAITVAVTLIIVAGAMAIWHFYFRPPPIEPASVEKMSFPLPDKPSVAVLPFKNLSGDQEQEYLADGITENIITALSKIPKMFVIASNSVFTYKGKPIKVQQVAEEMGVRYVLEGSLQKSGDRLRISAQLIDAIEGHHIWSEKYDRDLKDIFALQDEITAKIMIALKVKLTEGEQARLRYSGPENLEAFLKASKALAHFHLQNREANALARREIEEALSLVPENSSLYSLLAAIHLMDLMLGSTRSSLISFAQADKCLKKALALNEDNPDAYLALGFLYVLRKEHDEAIAAAERAVTLSPNGADAFANLGWILAVSGRPEEGVKFLNKAIRLNPLPPSMYFNQLGGGLRLLGRYEDAVAAYKKALDREPTNLFAHIGLAATYPYLGRQKEAHAEASKVLKLDPEFSVEDFAKKMPFKNKADTEGLVAALRKAGLPEKPLLPLPDRPSIAVLPFVNMSGDSEQEYFSDGITEEIITALSKVPKLFVIARNSAFTYKGKPVKVQNVGRELGVKYVLEGSVRKADDRVRISAQLIDTTTGHHLWTERYDRELKDIFALQDEITMKILTAVRVKLTEGEQARLYGKRAKNLDSFLRVLEGMPYFYRFTIDSNVQARKMFEEAIDLDPEYSEAFTMLGWTYLMEVWFGLSESPGMASERVVELAQKALSLDDTNDSPHSLLAHVYLMRRQFEIAIAHAKRAVALDPNGADAQAHLGIILNYAGRREGAIASLEKAIRLNPIPPNWYLFSLGEAYCLAREHEKALAIYDQALHLYPGDIRALVGLAATNSLLGLEEEARVRAAQIVRMEPKFNFEIFVKTLPFKNTTDTMLLLDSLAKAGVK
ncbi:tetratricopeptide repeat protein [Thermodesulfobacteriota bacterium]